jgi:carbon-monoxide dehydrogenase medium subunit
MKPPAFEHHLPRTLQEALEKLRDLQNARLIAGGQSLMPMLNLRLAYPDHLIDLNGLDELAYIREVDKEIRIGAMTAQRTIEFSEVVRRRLPLMSEAVLFLGHRQTRNRGTIGGSLCHLDPSAELPLVARAFDATVVVANAVNVRTTTMTDFAADLMTPALEPGEMVVEIRFKPWPERHGWAFTEFSRRKGDFAIVAVAALVEIGRDGRIAAVSLALGGVAPVPIRVASAESMLVGNAPAPDLLAEASTHCGSVEAIDDPFAPGWYRQTIAPKLALRVLKLACDRAGRSRQ